MPKRSTVVLRRTLSAVVLLLAVAAGAFALLRTDPWADRGSGLPQQFELNLEGQLAVDPSLIQFTQTADVSVPFAVVRGLAVGPEDRIYVAGDRAVRVLRADGTPQTVIELEGQPSCLAVGGGGHMAPGRIYVGTGRQIELFDPAGAPLGTWAGLSEKTVLTSIAAANDGVFAADAGERVVLHYNDQGVIIGRIGGQDPDRDMPGFVVPSACFDVAVGPDGAVHAVNPGARRIQRYTPEGALEGFWGQAGATIRDFFGCCNPAHLALFVDGRFVTSEKGIPRIKVYSEQGEFQCVVAGPQQLGVRAALLGDPRLGEGQRIFDVATDGRGRVLVLDPIRRRVRVFEPAPGGPRRTAGRAVHSPY